MLKFYGQRRANATFLPTRSNLQSGNAGAPCSNCYVAVQLRTMLLAAMIAYPQMADDRYLTIRVTQARSSSFVVPSGLGDEHSASA